ncbi:MAG: TIM barrel protein, partial [Pseudomonadota bacterium]
DSLEDAELALKKDPPFTLAIHPHLFMPIRSMIHVDELLKEYNSKEQRKYVKFIPDTAHLTIVEDDPAQAIRKYKDHLAAIHFKDWLPHFGRYSHRYARGFMPLASISTVMESANANAVFTIASGESDDQLFLFEPRHGCGLLGQPRRDQIRIVRPLVQFDDDLLLFHGHGR